MSLTDTAAEVIEGEVGSYNRDKTILYYSSTQQIDFIKNLNISHFTFSKHLKNGSYYLGKYLFTREAELHAKVKDISIIKLGLR